jgi:uncharacterized membrane protein YeaQ/YmgE (transglycosylase-associated protein family)
MGATIAVRLPWPGKNQAGFLVHPGLVSRLGQLQSRWFKGPSWTDAEIAGRRLPHSWQPRSTPVRSVAVMGIVSLLILGLLAGALARWLLPGDDPGGVLVTMLIGVGALLGGFLAGALFGADPLGGFFELSTWVTAVAGSIVLLLLLYRIVTRRRRTV